MELVEDPIQGNPRSIDANSTAGKWLLVDIQSKLFERAQAITTSAGCKPRWGKLLSEACAPAFACGQFHRGLAGHAGTTLTGGKDTTNLELTEAETHTPPEWDDERMGGAFLKDSTWLTMWLEHFPVLASLTTQEPLASLRQMLTWSVEKDSSAREALSVRPTRHPNGTLSALSIPEEGWWGNAHRLLGLSYGFAPSTYVLWTLDSIVPRLDGGEHDRVAYSRGAGGPLAAGVRRDTRLDRVKEINGHPMELYCAPIDDPSLEPDNPKQVWRDFQNSESDPDTAPESRGATPRAARKSRRDTGAAGNEFRPR